MYLRWHKTYEKRAAKEIQSVFQNWASNIVLSGSPYQFANQMDAQFKDEDLIKAYVKLYLEIGVVHGKRVGKEINRSKKEFDPLFFQEAYEKYVKQYLQQFGLERVFGIRQTFIDYLVGVIKQRAGEGLFGDSPDPSRIATWIQQQSGSRNFYRWEALRIARTESTAASNLGGLRAVENSGYVMEKEWVSALDSRTRRQPKDWYDHREMDGKKIPLEEPFVMGSAKGGEDRLMFPGDPKGRASNIINCRCTLIYKPVKGDDGLILTR